MAHADHPGARGQGLLGTRQHHCGVVVDLDDLENHPLPLLETEHRLVRHRVLSLVITTSSPGSQDRPAIAAAYPSAVLTVRAISSFSAPKKEASFFRASSADWHIWECHSIGGTCSS